MFERRRACAVEPHRQADADRATFATGIPFGLAAINLILMKSGDVKGTISDDVRLLLVSNEVRRHRLISISYISQILCHGRGRESSLVVPAIPSKLFHDKLCEQSRPLIF